MEDQGEILNDILQATPYESCVDLDDNSNKFQLGTVLYKSRIQGTIYCEYNAVHVTQEIIQAFIRNNEFSHFSTFELQSNLADLWLGHFGRWIQLRQNKSPLVITQFSKNVQTVDKGDQFHDGSKKFNLLFTRKFHTSVYRNIDKRINFHVSKKVREEGRQEISETNVILRK